MKRSPQLPLLLASDPEGEIFEIPGLYMTGMILGRPVLPAKNDCIELPGGSDLFRLPGRAPVGYDPVKNEYVTLREYRGMPVEAVAAFVAPAYLQILPASFETKKGAQRLPLYCYTAAGWMNGKFVVPALRIDPDQRQDYRHIDLCMVERKAGIMLKRFPRNRLVAHLVNNCVKRYGCPAARNFVMGRWECPIPASRACNSACLGCISLQPRSSGFKAPHERIAFVPTPEEIIEFTVEHLETAPRPVVSFGQGCEGEPLLVGDVLEEAIGGIRKRTRRGIINLNSNGSLPRVVERLCRAGLDSMRVSLSSAQRGFYDAYYRPKGYGFDDVKESLRMMRSFGRWTSINYLIFPGFTDTHDEIAALGSFIMETRINMIQTRNLNIDPEWYIDKAGIDRRNRPVGMRKWVSVVKKQNPGMMLGYFNPPLSVMKKMLRSDAA